MIRPLVLVLVLVLATLATDDTQFSPADARCCDIDKWSAVPAPEAVQALNIVQMVHHHNLGGNHLKRKDEKKENIPSGVAPTVMLTMATPASHFQLGNMHCSLRRLNLRYALGAVGGDMMRWGAVNKVPTIDLAAWAGLSSMMVADLTARAAPQPPFPPDVPAGLACLKLGLVYKVSLLGFNVLFISPDLAFLDNPLLLYSRVLGSPDSEVDAMFQSGASLVGTLWGDVQASRAFFGPDKSPVSCFRDGAFSRVEPYHHGSQPTSRSALQCMCDMWNTTNWLSSVASEYSQPERFMGFLNSGWMWFRATRSTAFLRHAFDQIYFVKNNNDQAAMHLAACDVKPASVVARASIRSWLFTDTRHVAGITAATGVPSRHGQMSIGSSPFKLTGRFCAGLQKDNQVHPSVVHAFFNIKVDSSTKVRAMKQLAWFLENPESESIRSPVRCLASPSIARCPERLGAHDVIPAVPQTELPHNPDKHKRYPEVRDLLPVHPRCPARSGPPKAPGKLHIFTLSVESATGRTVESLLELTTCPGGSNRSTCPIKNLGDVISNPMVTHPGLFPRGFSLQAKPIWLSLGLSALPDDDLVIFLDGGDILYGGCGNHHPQGLEYVAWERLNQLLLRVNASVVFGAELNRYDMPIDLKVPAWAKARCPDLTSADGSGDWVYEHTWCWRPPYNFCPPSGNPSEEGTVSSWSNVNTGLVAGYVCEVRAAALALAAESDSDNLTRLRGETDQGKYWSYFMDDVNEWPAAAGSPSEVTLDYCGELVFNFPGDKSASFPNPDTAMTTLPLMYSSSHRSVTLDHQGPSGSATGPAPQCFVHFPGKSYLSKEFGDITKLNGVWCNRTVGISQKTGACKVIQGPEEGHGLAAEERGVAHDRGGHGPGGTGGQGALHDRGGQRRGERRGPAAEGRGVAHDRGGHGPGAGVQGIVHDRGGHGRGKGRGSAAEGRGGAHDLSGHGPPGAGVQGAVHDRGGHGPGAEGQGAVRDQTHSKGPPEMRNT